MYVQLTVFLFRSKGLGKRENQWTEVISWEPRAFIYHNFLVSFFHFVLCVCLNQIMMC